MRFTAEAPRRGEKTDRVGLVLLPAGSVLSSSHDLSGVRADRTTHPDYRYLYFDPFAHESHDGDQDNRADGPAGPEGDAEADG